MFLVLLFTYYSRQLVSQEVPSYIFYRLLKQRMKSIRIASFSGPYSARMQENMDQKNSEYEHFSHSENVSVRLTFDLFF